MKNIDIINQYMQQKNITCAFRTIPEWNKDGYRVIKGEKAHTLELWQPYRSGKRTVFKLTKKHYFTADQVTNKAAVMTESITETVTKQPETSVTEQIQEQQPEQIQTKAETSVTDPYAIGKQNGWIDEHDRIIITGWNECGKQFKFTLLYPSTLAACKQMKKAWDECGPDQLTSYKALILLNPKKYAADPAELEKISKYMDELISKKAGTAVKVKLTKEQKLAMKFSKECFRIVKKSTWNNEQKEEYSHYILHDNRVTTLCNYMFVQTDTIPGIETADNPKAAGLVQNIIDRINNDENIVTVKLPLLASLGSTDRVRLVNNDGLDVQYLKTVLKAGIEELEYSQKARVFYHRTGNTIIGIMACLYR